MVVQTQMVLKTIVPLFHAIDLELVVFLARALAQVALGPLAEAGGDLLDTLGGVLTVVFTELDLVVSAIVATVATRRVEFALHALGVVGELSDPGVL